MTEPNRQQARLVVGDIVTVQAYITGIRGSENDFWYEVVVFDSEDTLGLVDKPPILVPRSNVRRTITAYTEDSQHD